MYDDLMHLQTRSIVVNDWLRTHLHAAGLSYCASRHDVSKMIQILPDPDSVPNSATLTLFSLSAESGLLIKTMRSFKFFYLPETLSIQVGDPLFISNCQMQEAFIVKKVTHMNGQLKIETQLPLKYLYKKSAEVHFLKKETFFVGQSENNSSDHSLYFRDSSGEKTELVEQVQSMQVEIFPHWVAIQMDLLGNFLKKKIFLDVGFYE